MRIVESKLSVFGKYFNNIHRDHGSFFTALFETFLKGSGGNRRRIAEAFPEYFNEFDITLDYVFEHMETRQYHVRYTINGQNGSCAVTAANTSDVRYQMSCMDDVEGQKLNVVEIEAY